ncbi:hypothetical protein AB1Y20_000240 [Prymnesium parvum]|uniref:N-acetyltransferase domain-containing protein n=1 Tax=Prymnesium parvum TaxID=97485 RepID=A0AB34K8G6_PRYPA
MPLPLLCLCLPLVGCWRLSPQAPQLHTKAPLRNSAPTSFISLLPAAEGLLQGERRDTIIVRRACPDDAKPLAQLCTDAFFGSHTFFDGPIIFLQRAQIFSRVLMQVSRRISIEDGRECRLLVATDSNNGDLCGCIDLAVHLYNEHEKRFELTVDEMPGRRGTYSWQPYVASLAVREDYRRQGIARMLMREAELTAKRWGYNYLSLEVAKSNDVALRFYERLGYRKLREDCSGTGATEVNVRYFWWDLQSVEKLILRSSLHGRW